MPGEQERLEVLHAYGILDRPADAELDAVLRVAASVAGVPTATLNLIDESRQCQLTTVGFAGTNSARSDSMCAVRFLEGRPVHVPDASLHPDYAANPWVTGRLAAVRLYASFPLISPDGHALGTLCVFDSDPGELTLGQLDRLQDLATVVVALFERRREARRSAELAAEAQEQRDLVELTMGVLEERQELTDAVLDTIDVAVVAADPSGRLTLFNRAALDWHGLPADSGVAPADHATTYNLLAADGTTPLAPEQVPLHRALVEGAVRDVEMVIAPPGQAATRVLVSGRALTRADGTPLGAVVAQTDVTADRRQREALEEAHSRLAERSAELERSNRELAQFAAVASHDLRSPLAVIDGYLELLLDVYGGQLDEEAQSWVGTARGAGVRMRCLIDALLAYAQAGGKPCAPQLVDTGEVYAHAVLDVAAEAEAAGVAVSAVQPLPKARVDAVLLRQLLQNLLTNAIRYRDPARPGTVTVSGVATGTGWEFAVADNGLGVAPDKREKVFAMFDTGAAGRGHGIGLATCHRIVERHGGRIWITETPGGGTTVRFTIPE
ncbi:GAF domain-containing protein [Motilibacter sp. E257]|uniref:Sensor-like histidine kinase SenX3 n=1 Tax=Motilibacter deserti TaxID=2714956 RepID=A0ABX0GXX1_9ACTN|nr:GAF domain-containing protein [Motilibacter deserti]